MNVNDTPRVSIIIPCRNEAPFISGVLENLLKQDYPSASIEIIIADGMSDDNTPEILREYEKKYPHIHVIPNPEKTAPYGLNAAIRHAKGEIIIRVDAHAAFPAGYVSQLVHQMEQSGADNVGGVLLTQPPDDKPVSRAIAIAMSSPFGVGNAWFRIGVAMPMETNMVPFGCFRKSIFYKIGFFDECLIRGQDVEFNGRIIKNGGKILLVPDIKITYFSRNSLKKLWQMYYQYGYFKPLVNRKLKTIMTFRQLAPFLFLTFLCGGLVLSIFFKPFLYYYMAVLALYISAALFFAFQKTGNTKDVMAVVLTFFILHFSYGIGYLEGILRFLILRKKPKSGSTRLTR